MSNSHLAITSNDGFAVQEKTSASAIVGRLIKFDGSNFIVDKSEILPSGTRLVANAVVTAWVHWDDKKPVEHLITYAGQHHPEREELSDLDESQWPIGLNGEPNDPWKDTRYVHLIDQKSGADYTFITDSIGGRRGVADLKGQVANVRSAHPTAKPVVVLGPAPWKTRFGMKLRPNFAIVEWIGRDEPDECPF
jgi:hypothetical protein